MARTSYCAKQDSERYGLLTTVEINSRVCRTEIVGTRPRQPLDLSSPRVTAIVMLAGVAAGHACSSVVVEEVADCRRPGVSVERTVKFLLSPK